jgi:hypothetical protein
VRCITNKHLPHNLRIVEEWVRLYAVGIAGLPGTDRRAQLEKIMLQALQEIVEYSKSEEVAKKAEERQQVTELLNHAVRAKLAVLHEQDDFCVEHLIDQVEAFMRT